MRRLTSERGPSESFKYDGLNRQVARTVGTLTTYSVYDGWTLLAEYGPGATLPSSAWLYGASGIVKELTTGYYYYQDGSGSTSQLADGSGHLLEAYRYDLQGTPIVSDPAGTVLPNGSAYGIRHLYNGEQWYSDLGLYDLRNRYYSPDIGRFLQPDPIGFGGDPSNLYRYCGNNPANGADPYGENGTITPLGNNAYNFGMSIFFSGGNTPTAQSFVNYAQGRLTNDFGSYHIATTITPSTGIISGMLAQNSFTFRSDLNGGYTSSAWNGGPAVLGFSNSAGGQGLSGQDLFLHEILHLLGAQDHYSGNGPDRVPAPGWENNIMGGGGGNGVDARNIAEIIASGGRGNTGNLFDYVGYSLSQAFSNTVDALNNYALSHGPGTGVITVSSSRSTQLYLLPLFGGYTSGGTVCPGDLCGGALANWTQAMIGIPGGGPQPGEGLHPHRPN